MLRRALVMVAVASLLTAIPATAHSPQRHLEHVRGLIQPAHVIAFNQQLSGNWFGYNVGAAPKRSLFKQVAATWQVPTARQHRAGQAEYSSAWVGIGGGCVTANCSATDKTLIQAGTEHDVAVNGSASYYAWFELIPAPSVRVRLTVRPGHLVRAVIAQVVPGLWHITLRNLTTGRSWSTTMPYSSTGLTAEWIVETPLLIGTDAGLAELPNLGRVHFDNALLNGRNPHLRPSQRIALSPDFGHVIAVASYPQADGNGFGACTWTTSCAIPSEF